MNDEYRILNIEWWNDRWPPCMLGQVGDIPVCQESFRNIQMISRIRRTTIMMPTHIPASKMPTITSQPVRVSNIRKRNSWERPGRFIPVELFVECLWTTSCRFILLSPVLSYGLSISYRCEVSPLTGMLTGKRIFLVSFGFICILNPKSQWMPVFIGKFSKNESLLSNDCYFAFGGVRFSWLLQMNSFHYTC